MIVITKRPTSVVVWRRLSSSWERQLAWKLPGRDDGLKHFGHVAAPRLLRRGQERKSSRACRPQAWGSFALGAGVPFFHKLEYGLPLVGELPAVRVPFDQSHRENTQPRKVSSQSAGSIRPISAA